MKKQLLLSTFLLFSLFSIAQNKVTFGVKAGVVSSGMRGDAINSFNQLLDITNGRITNNNRTGFFAGGFAAIPVSEQITIEPGLYYSQKGTELNGAIGVKGMEVLGVNAKARLNTSYIDMPVLVKLNLNGLQVFAGPQLSYLSKATLQTTAGLLGFNLLNTNMDAGNQYNKWDAALTGGVGYQFSNGFSVSAAYDHGITKADANRNMNAYNRAIKVGVGMAF